MTFLYYALPALALLAALILGHYPGERLLLAVAERRRRPPRAAAALPPARHLLFVRRHLPRGGALLGAALAGRAPPSAPRAARAAQADVTREERIQMKARTLVPAALLALALLAPAAAQAHVTLQPNEAPEGAYTVLDVRVPNESADANTTKVAVRFPEGFGDVSYQAVPGWQVKVVHDKLKKPIQTDDGPVTEGVSEVIFSGGKLPPGEFQDFPLSVQIPGKAGEELTFKAVQTYDDGEVVRWIGAPETEHPAPQVLVTPPKEAGQATTAADTSEGAAANSTASSSSGSDDKGLAIAALVVAVIALLIAGAAIFGTRRGAA
ncbi:MAG TPA: YcnI family protein [Solirubrobacterales bacterium]|nr:YcnI family protein [Solirubrobacterales bacterium]